MTLSTPPVFIDSHCHWDFPEFDGERARLIESLSAAGIAHLVIPAVSPEDFARAKTQADSTRAAGLPCALAAGLHPWWMQSFLEVHAQAAPQRLRDWLAQQCLDPYVCALGETGLDAAIALPLQAQESLLEVHLEMALALDKPVILHSRKTHGALLRIIKRFGGRLRGVIHGFSGSYAEADGLVRANFCLGVGGVITYPRANKTRDALSRVPLSALLLETDAPSMPPAGAQGQRNTPLTVLRVAEVLAQLRNEPVAQIALQTTRNARQLFALPDASA